MLRKLAFGAIAGLALSVLGTVSAHASLVDLKKIVVSSNIINNWLQVSEVVAKNTSGLDQALAGLATATGSAYLGGAGGNSPDKAIDGVMPKNYPDIFHSATTNPSETLTIDFFSSFTLTELSIYGRTDCCTERDVYDVEVFNSAGKSIFSQTGLSAYNSAYRADATLPTTSPVPLPAALPMLIAGLGSLAFMRRRA